MKTSAFAVPADAGWPVMSAEPAGAGETWDCWVATVASPLRFGVVGKAGSVAGCASWVGAPEAAAASAPSTCIFAASRSTVGSCAAGGAEAAAAAEAAVEALSTAAATSAGCGSGPPSLDEVIAVPVDSSFALLCTARGRIGERLAMTGQRAVLLLLIEASGKNIGCQTAEPIVRLEPATAMPLVGQILAGRAVIGCAC